MRLQPEVDTVPQVWILGSSDYSGALAAELGLPFAFAHFINPRGGDEVARAYRQNFKATEKRPRPRLLVCTFAICAERDDERRYVMSQRARAVIGGPQKSRRELTALVENYTADELMVLTITGDYESRRRSYELLIDAF